MLCGNDTDFNLVYLRSLTQHASTVCVLSEALPSHADI